MLEKCKKHDMKKSKGIINGVSGRGTMWMDPKKWKLVDVMKCKLCGHSESL